MFVFFIIGCYSGTHDAPEDKQQYYNENIWHIAGKLTHTKSKTPFFLSIPLFGV